MAELYTFTAEYAPGFGPTNPPADGDWVTLGDVTSASWGRGRQNETDAMEPGRANLVIDDPEGDIFQSVIEGDIPPLTPVRCVVLYDSTGMGLGTFPFGSATFGGVPLGSSSSL